MSRICLVLLIEVFAGANGYVHRLFQPFEKFHFQVILHLKSPSNVVPNVLAISQNHFHINFFYSLYVAQHLRGIINVQYNFVISESSNNCLLCSMNDENCCLIAQPTLAFPIPECLAFVGHLLIAWSVKKHVKLKESEFLSLSFLLNYPS